MGPAIPATCRACGQKVRVPYSSMFVIVPIIMFCVVLAQNTPSLLVKVLLWSAGLAIAAVLQWKFVPLVKV